MYIKEIELYNFRNYEDEKISFDKGVNIFLGSNAQGKTNLLEGIYLNSVGKSFKKVRDKELVKFGKDYCRVRALFNIDGEDKQTDFLIRNDGKKGIKFDGLEIKKSSELLDRIYTIIFSPEDLKIVKDEPEKRRNFIDRELCQIRKGYLADINSYKKILKQRNTYLGEENIDLNMLAVWDYQLDQYGSRIRERRSEFIDKLNVISHEIHSKITGGRENLEIRYEPSIFDQNSIELDLRNRTTRRGPHRDDFKISIDGIDLRKYGSQGQQRTAALSLKLSEIKIIEEEKGDRPILLLDDVLSELDNQRQIYLMNTLGENQMFITTTDITGEVARNLPDGKIIKISGGKVLE